jgi:hypothetical protein
MFRVYSLLILPMLLKLGVPSDLAWWTEPFVIEELQESATLFVFLAAIGIFPWNDKLSFWGFVLMVVLWLAVPYRWPL